jgi:pimeloyl-ACP methyl ester carboxylesterase
MAWGERVKALKTPVLIITGDADGSCLSNRWRCFACSQRRRRHGQHGQATADLGLATMASTSHTAAIDQPDLLDAFIELRGEARRGCLCDRGSWPNVGGRQVG